jgi:hypothetical protein
MICSYKVMPWNCFSYEVQFEKEVLESLSLNHDTDIPALVYQHKKSQKQEPPPYSLEITSTVHLTCNFGLYSIKKEFNFLTSSIMFLS